MTDEKNPTIVRIVRKPPQELADRHTLLAQYYAGYFVGHPYRQAQQRVGPDAITVDRSKPWVEPNVLRDDCLFCERLTDEEAIRRVAGYQQAIDVEVLSARQAMYLMWLEKPVENEVPVTTEVLIADGYVLKGIVANAENRRAYIERFPDQFDVKPFPMVSLPLRLKRKLCIEWNHLYTAWMAETGCQYDWEKREFFKFGELTDVEAEKIRHYEDTMRAWMNGIGAL